LVEKLNLKTQKENTMNRLEFLKSEFASVQKMIDNFNPADHIDEAEYDQYLDDCYGDIEIAGMDFSTSHALKELDPTAYRCGFNDYCDALDLEGIAEYLDLVEKLTDIECEIEDLEYEVA
jgi:hypothetical protein